MINWPHTQTALKVASDGKPGPITYTALTSVVGHACQPVGDCLAKYADGYGMNTPARLAEFLAQVANETGGFSTWEENLNYSVKGMLATWPTHFTQEQAQAAAGNPIEIASRAYGGRNGNAPYPSRDGYTYRGRGALQLTGKTTYAKFGGILGLDLVNHPELASNPYDSTLIALEFFKERSVNAAVDRGDFTESRRLTNGGSNGLDNVARLRKMLLGVIS